MDPDGFSSSLDLMKTVGAFWDVEEPSGSPSSDPEEIYLQKSLISFIQNTNCSLLLPDDGLNTQEERRITQYNNPTIVGKYSLEVLFRASDNIPHHYPKF